MNDDSGDEAVTAMASPVAERAAAQQRTEPGSDPELIQALPEHLKAGRTIYIRGQRGCIVEMDYPNIFWVLDGTEKIKHRNFEVDKEMFQVVQGTESINNISLPVRNSTSSRPLFTMVTNDPINVEATDCPDSSENPAGFPADALIGQLSLRALTLYSQEYGADISCFDTNARIHLLHCSTSSFRFPNKLASMFIQGCSECKVQYSSMISSVELLKCFSTEIRCTNECGTITIESCADITVTFPTSSSAVLIVCTNSRNIQLRAECNGDVVKDTTVTIEDQQTEGDGEGEGEDCLEQSSAPPLEHPQIRTLWDGTTFDSQRIERDSAHVSGHIRNLNG